MPLSTASSVAPRRASAPAVLPWRSAFAGSLVLAIAAHVSVPFWPVPLTLQSLAVLMLGATLGPVAGLGAVLAWIAEGVVGLPVFAGGVGPATLVGPTGGYIVGYLAAVVIAGVAAHRGWLQAVWTAALAFVVVDAALFAFGVGWLSVLIGWRPAVAGGLTPFLLGEALKISLAVAGVALLKDRLPRS